MSVPLFDSRFISQHIQDALPKQPKLLIRPLASTDYAKGFLTALSHLTTVGEMNEAEFLDRFWYLKAHAHEYYTIVIEDEQAQKIVACGTVFVERKFVHKNGLVGHIEDIVVHQDYRKHRLGYWIIQQLRDIGRATGCYKVILDCSEKNVGFYEKCGFTRKEVEMVWYVDKDQYAGQKTQSKL